ncbi:Anaphase-promoting complex subunit 5 [Hibiscus syriacus]|uniref:Anaphase-promoting complex subunit 5 n=1 Tax=Hibiscus syriacus TaxID=106335 RepID=A0A6A2WMM4_HIBSY|nr:anaphase-promoting complex subunit 5-like isoform X2 [Hibiscus syriacus]KAE8654930.1 Anaphase-promoting complex subunit 5 [Hibiscus syriacus]
MAGAVKAPGVFAITPHKVSVCILVHSYASPSQISVPFPFSSVSQHSRLGLYLLALAKSCDDILEPKLDHLINQLREIDGLMDDWLTDHVTSRLSSLSSPDDLFNFFNELRETLGGPDSGVMDDDQVILDPNSNLGMFLRRCILAFNLLTFEGVCHLLTNIGIYCKEGISSSSYERRLDYSGNDLESLSEYENMDLNLVFKKINEEMEARKRATDQVTFHLHLPKDLSTLVEDVEVFADPKAEHNDKGRESSSYASGDLLRNVDPDNGVFLRTNWQIQGYLMEQADAIEKHGSSFTLNAFELTLRQLQKLAPEFHRVHFLRYLNNLYHDEYFSALENLHRYFDYSAGTEGFDFVPSAGCNDSGRFEIALLCLGMMQFHFGHPKKALEVLTEAVLVSQQHCNDTCLAYTLAAICNLLSEISFSTASGILGSPFSPMTNVGTSLSVQQQLFVLLKGSLKRAESLKLKQLIAANHLAMAKFDLTHVQRPLLSFGPKTSMKLRTCPIIVFKELRSGYHLISDFCCEGSTMTTDGAFSTAWLKNLQKPMGSLVMSQDSGSRNNSNPFLFFSQPISIPGSVLQLVGSSYLHRATAWEMYGSAPLARVNALVYATCFADASSSSDAALVHVKLIQHLAVFKGYKEAFAALKIAEEKFLCASKSRILILKLQLLHEHALHRGHLKLAQQACDELGVLASSVTAVDLELKTEASLRHSRTLLAAKQFRQAAAVAHSLFCMCYKFNLQVESATVLLLLAEIHMKSGNAVAGLPYALASLSYCQSFNLDLLRASATLTLAELWLSLGSNHTKTALTLLHGAFPMILGHGGLELCARAYITEAKCYLSDPSFSVSDNPELVLDPLRQAADELQALEYHELMAEAFYLMAIVYDKLGQLEQREEAASSFKNHVMALDHPHDVDDPILS